LGQIGTEETDNIHTKKSKEKKSDLPVPICPKKGKNSVNWLLEPIQKAGQIGSNLSRLLNISY
jgi:hypothetical protein